MTTTMTTMTMTTTHLAGRCEGSVSREAGKSTAGFVAAFRHKMMLEYFIRFLQDIIPTNQTTNQSTNQLTYKRILGSLIRCQLWAGTQRKSQLAWHCLCQKRNNMIALTIWYGTRQECVQCTVHCACQNAFSSDSSLRSCPAYDTQHIIKQNMKFFNLKFVQNIDSFKTLFIKWPQI